MRSEPLYRLIGNQYLCIETILYLFPVIGHAIILYILYNNFDFFRYFMQVNVRAFTKINITLYALLAGILYAYVNKLYNFLTQIVS